MGISVFRKSKTIITLVFTDVEFLLFADDLTIYKRIANIMDSTCLQSNLNRLYE